MTTLGLKNFGSLSAPIQPLSEFDDILGNESSGTQGAGCIGYTQGAGYLLGSVGAALDSSAGTSAALLAYEAAIANSANGSGVDLVGGAGRVVATITALRALLKTGVGKSFVLGYYASGDGGGGQYFYDPADTTSADNGGSIIVAADGGRWKISNQGGVFSVKQFGAKGDNSNDDTSAIQATINFVCTLNSITGYGGYAYMPVGVYKTSSVIKTYNGTTSCGLRGAGQFATQFAPNGNFTVVNIAGQRLDSGDFSIVFPTTAAGSINSACVGVEFCSAALQMSYATVRNITVYYAYNAFVMNNTSATMFLTTMQNLSALRPANLGFNLQSAVGSTTLVMNQCYARCDNSVNANYSNGMSITNFDDVQMNQCAVDNALNTWFMATGYSQLQMNGCAYESCSITTNGQRAVQFNGVATVVNGVKLTGCVYNTGGTANVFSMLGSALNLTINGLSEAFATVTATTVFYAYLNAATSHLFVLDRSILPSKVVDGGFFANHAYEGVRKTSSNNVPNYGTWVVGDYVKNGTPAVGQPKGWYCTAAGSPGTWVSEGNL